MREWAVRMRELTVHMRELAVRMRELAVRMQELAEVSLAVTAEDMPADTVQVWRVAEDLSAILSFLEVIVSHFCCHHFD